MAKFVKPVDYKPGMPDFEFLCPGCGCKHGVWTTSSASSPNAVWSYNNNENSPTVVPSIKVTRNEDICHSFIKDGMIQFLSDCTHPLANQTVTLPEISV